MTILTHKHHIIPRHAGGTDDPSNLIELTVMDHAIAHKVLYGLYGRWQDKLAWDTLSGRVSKEEAIRIALSKSNSGINHPFYGKKRPEHSLKMKQLGIIPPNQKGKKKSSATRKKMSENNAMHNPENRKKVSEGLKGRFYSEGTRQKLRIAAIKQWEKKRASK